MARVTLSNVQGNILKGFNKPNVRLIFFKFGDPKATMDWLKDVAERIPSTIDLMKASEELYKKRLKQPNYRPQEIWLHVSLSKEGIEALKLEVPPSRGLYEGLGRKTKVKKPVKRSTHDPFDWGMKKRAEQLGDTGDSAPEKWIEPYKHKEEKNKDVKDLSTEIHALFIVAADQEDDLDIKTSELVEEATHKGLICVGMEIGKALENEQGKQVEHFGFRDGVSQPLIVRVDTKDIKNRQIYKDKFYPEDFVLSDLTGDLRWANNGSFLVFRRLQQHVSDFWNFISGTSPSREEAASTLSKSAGSSVAAALPLSGVVRSRRKTDGQTLKLPGSPEEIAAKLVGRWKSGAPLDGSPDYDPVAPEYSDRNDFLYLLDKDAISQNDPKGYKTPTFAHIRVANPRDDKSRYHRTRGIGTPIPMDNLKLNAQHRILRRGIPYGPPWAKEERETKRGETKKEVDRGLLFICYQRDIAEQFEKMQSQWSYYQKHPNYTSETRPRGSRDAHENIINFLRDKARMEGKEFRGGLEQFVTTTGGGYFFSPSIHALKNLHEYSKLKPK